MPVDLAPITGSEPGSFAHHVICERHPAIIKDVQTTYPYPRLQQAQLDELEHETLHGTITHLPDTAGDREYWDASGGAFYGRRWTDVPFLWAESYFPNRLLALRTLKSDVIVGLDAHTLATQDATNTPWRTNGSRAVIQTFMPESSR
jgi:hypothetical protein